MSRRRGRSESVPKRSRPSPLARTGSRIVPRTAARLPRVQRRPRPMLAKPGFSLRGKLRFTLLVTTLFGFLMARTYPDQLRTWLTEQPVLSRLTLLAGLITPGLLVALLHRRRDWELP